MLSRPKREKASMIAPTEKVLTDLTQVCVVVRDIEASMKKYVETAGIGPWAVYDFGPPDVTNMFVRGKPAEFRYRLGMTWTKDRMWELIQPVGPSPFSEFLEEHGEAMHHTLVQHEGHSFDEVIRRFSERGCAPIMSFVFRGIRIAYLDTFRDLRMYLEVIERPPHLAVAPKRPATPPKSWYPYAPAPDHRW
jgi:methylmalonyl-CoA/ethylmalonyl-CoA epimerase